MKIPIREAEALSDLFQSPTWKIFKKHLMEKRRVSLLESSLSAEDMSMVKYFRGGVDHIVWLNTEMKRIHKSYLEYEQKSGDGEDV